MVEPRFTFVQLRYFCAAADHGTMTAASRSLRVSQSAVSTAVAQLEEQLGVQLFLRQHARGLALTSAGRRFLPEAQSLLRHAQDLAEAARDLGGSLVGGVTLGCFVTLAPFHLAPLLTRFGADYPGVHVEVEEGEFDQLQTALRNGDVELALMYELGLSDDIDREVLDLAPPYAILPPDHRFAGADKVSLKDLAGDPLILLDLPHSGDYFRSLVGSAGVSPNVRFRTGSYETVRALVADGRGYSILNQRPRIDTTYTGGTVVSVPLSGRLPALPMVLASSAGARLTRRAEALAETCRAVLRPDPVG